MALASEGTKLRRGDGATPTESFTLIGAVSSVSGFGGGSTTINDVTTLQDSFVQKLPGLRDEGQGTMTVQWDATQAQFQGLHSDRAAATKRTFQIEMPDETVFEFSAYVLTFEVSAETDSPLTVDITLEIDGEIDVTWPES